MTMYERGIEAGKAEAYQEVEPLMKTTCERGVEEGERRVALRLLEAKFGPLSADVKRQVEAMSRDAVARLQIDILWAQRLEDLRLGD